MADSADLISSLYTRLLLRDVLGKITPGALVLVVAYFACVSSAPSPSSTVLRVASAPLGVWVILALLGWYAGVTVQAVGEAIGLLRHCPRGQEAEFYKGLVEMQSTTPDAKQTHERLVVIKEACGNASLAIVLSLALLLVRLLPSPAGRLTVLGILSALGAIALFWMHRKHLRRQEEWRTAVAQYGRAPSRE
jgi:hypothetical protein